MGAHEAKTKGVPVCKDQHTHAPNTQLAAKRNKKKAQSTSTTIPSASTHQAVSDASRSQTPWREGRMPP